MILGNTSNSLPALVYLSNVNENNKQKKKEGIKGAGEREEKQVKSL